MALREAPAETDAEIQALRSRLSRLDSRAPDGPWTVRTLAILRSHPAVPAGGVCGLVGQDKERFKLNVRKLKNLGLTESLETGYRLSKRGEALLDFLRSEASVYSTERDGVVAVTEGASRSDGRVGRRKEPSSNEPERGRFR